MFTEIPLTKVAHRHMSAALAPRDIAVDATLGNGHDAAFLLGLISPGGFLYGFDIQRDAIEASRRRLASVGTASAIRLIQDSHARLMYHLPPEDHGRVAVVTYNLGYLPGGAKAITTKHDSTLESLRQAFLILRPGGIVSVMCYQGHDEGAREMRTVENWVRGLGDVGEIEAYEAPPGRQAPPKLFIITRR